METVYKTDDINLTSFLLTQKGINFISAESDRPGHFMFVLAPFDKCKELQGNFFNNFEAPAFELFSKKEMLISRIKGKSQQALTAWSG